jgi:hypothetical protein
LGRTIHQSSGWPGFDAGCDPLTDDVVEVPDIMRTLEPEVVDAVWAAIEPLLPTGGSVSSAGLSPASRL